MVMVTKAMTATKTPTRKLTPLEKMLAQAKRAGMPEDQVRRFMVARYVPQPKAMLFHAAARECDKPDGPDMLLLGGARGGGKSHCVFAQIALDDCQRFSGIKCLYLRAIGKKAREQLEDLRQSVLFATTHEYKRAEGFIVFPNGSLIMVGHFKDERDVDNYLGIEYDIIAVEEATTLSVSKHKALRDSNRTSKPGWRPRMYYTTNPGGISHNYFRQRFILPYLTGTQHYTRFIPATVDDNKFVDPDYKRKLEENTGWKLRAYRYGDWDIAAGQYFTTFKSEHNGKPHHVIPPFPIPRAWRKWCGLDYGFTHPTVCYLCAQDGDGNIFVVAEHKQAKWLVKQQAGAIHAMLARFGLTVDNLETFVAGTDVFAKRGTGADIAEQYEAEGIRLFPADTDRINAVVNRITQDFAQSLSAAEVAALPGAPK
jgi:hypothetical protein